MKSAMYSRPAQNRAEKKRFWISATVGSGVMLLMGFWLVGPASPQDKFKKVKPLDISKITQKAVPIKVPHDLAVENFDWSHEGGGKYKLTATLRNVGLGDYAGGGHFIISRDGVGMKMPSETPPYLVLPNDGKELAKKAIPALKSKQAMVLTATTMGKGVFTARAAGPMPVVDGPSAPPLDSHPANDKKSINLLKKQTITINNAVLDLLIGDKLSKTKVHLHHKNSFVEVPGFLAKKTFDIPAWHKHIDTPFFVPDIDIYYKVNDINSKKVDLDLKNKGVEMCIEFETSGSEVVGTGTGPDSFYPDINTDHLKVCAHWPLHYASGHEYFSFKAPTVTVKANWHFNTDIPGLEGFLNSKLKGLNGKMADAVEDMFGHSVNLDKVNRQLNKMFRQQFLRDSFGNPGRILSATINPTSIVVVIETPK